MKGIRWLREARDELLAQPRDLLVLRMTAFLLLLHGASTWTLDLPIRVVCGFMLISNRLLASRAMWLVLTGFLVWINSHEWFWIDNHKYLMTYWCIACTVAVGTGNAERTLAWSGRILVCLAFGFALIWKFAAGQYLDGTFLHHALLTDSRLEVVSRMIGGLSAADLAENRTAQSGLLAFPGPGTEVVLRSSGRVAATAIFLSYWTLLIEGAIALAFLSRVRLFSRWRDALLLVFIASTYVIVPVVGFAFILTVMGFAQCDERSGSSAKAYLGAFVLVQLISAPWADMVLR